MFKKKVSKKWLNNIILETEVSLFRYAYSFINDENLARDIVQEAYLKLWEKPPDGIEGFVDKWLFKVVRNLCVDRLRRKQTVNNKSLDVKMYFEANLTDTSEQVSRRQYVKIIVNAINELSGETREIMALKFVEGLSYKEISIIMDKTENNIAVIVYNSINRIREILREGGHLEKNK